MKKDPEVAYVGSILAYRCANFTLIHRAIVRMQDAVLSQCGLATHGDRKLLAGTNGKH